ncbi:serine/arginine repetitive matrix protein 1-like isoform X3 [Littorina saxatilis]|uniref:serine/arginine repetitive matrix protein 1-like isoform X3 n=1 Tax=Littorina saxatilis TaxID=31220 RepID=UPI0038B59D5F
MDPESSTKFIGSLTKFLQSLCNGYVEFEDGVELIGHIYLSVDTGKRGRKIDYILNEKVCKSDNSVTFISNSFHAQPDSKGKAASGKEGDSKKDDGETSDSDSVVKSTNVGTLPHRTSQGSRSLPSPNQQRSSVQAGTKRPGSPLKAPTPPQRRAPTPPSQRRMQSSAAKGPSGSPASKTVPSSPSSSSQDNIPSPSPLRKRSETSQPPSNQSENAGADNDTDHLMPPNIVPINPTPDLASFLGSLTGDNHSSRDQRSPLRDTKPDTDVTFIKEEFMSEPSSCAQAGSSGQHSGRSGDDGSGLYPVMLHQNTSVFPSTSAGYPPGGFSGGASATATSQQPAFPGSSTSSDLFNPVPGTSQDGTDPSGLRSRQRTHASGNHSETFPATGGFFLEPSAADLAPRYTQQHQQHQKSDVYICPVCNRAITNRKNIARHRRKCEQKCHLQCPECGEQFHRRDYYQKHLWKAHLTQDPGPRRLLDDVTAADVTDGSPGWRRHQLEEVEAEEEDADVGVVLQQYVTQASSSTSSQQPS